MGSSSLLSMMEARMPPGFRFHPRDDELVLDYLAKRIANSGCHMLIDVDLNKVEPWDLPDEACVGGKEWYFYSLRDRKYATGQRTNRATVSGYWKATGKDRHVVVDYSRRNGGGAAGGGRNNHNHNNNGSSALVGMRKTLVFYKGRAPKGKKTDWVMHEFRMESADTFRREEVDCTTTAHPFPNANAIAISSSKEDWVLCRVFFKSRTLTVKPSAAGAAPTATTATTTTGGGDNCYDDTAGSSTASLMVDTFMTMDHPQPPPHPVPQQHFSLQGYHEQVPCFSNVLAATASSKPPPASYLQSLPAVPGMRSFTQLVSLPDLGHFLGSVDNKPPVTSALFASPQQLGKPADRDAGPREDRLPAMDQGAGVQPMWS